MKLNSEEKISSSQFAIRDSECSACGTSATRSYAKFCRVCGKLLLEEYQPLDALRASYRLQGKSFQFAAPEKPERPETANLFEENKNAASATATALIVYSLVPYLGILFCPFALLSGGFGILTAYRRPSLGGGKTSAYSVVLSVIIFAAQVFLWGLFYLKWEK